MDRRNFLKNFTAGATSIVPAVALTSMIVHTVHDDKGKEKAVIQIDIEEIPDGLTVTEVLDIYKREGILITESYIRGM